jgi:hypothetical protein
VDSFRAKVVLQLARYWRPFVYIIISAGIQVCPVGTVHNPIDIDARKGRYGVLHRELFQASFQKVLHSTSRFSFLLSFLPAVVIIAAHQPNDGITKVLPGTMWESIFNLPPTHLTTFSTANPNAPPVYTGSEIFKTSFAKTFRVYSPVWHP